MDCANHPLGYCDLVGGDRKQALEILSQIRRDALLG